MPATPAIPNISPCLKSNEISFSTLTPSLLSWLTFFTSRTGFPTFKVGFLIDNSTFLPTIFSANSSGDVFSVEKFATTFPPRITDTVSVILMISLSLCVIKTMVTPCSLNDLRISNKPIVSCGVRTPVGSSKIRILAPLLRAFKISTRCCIPTGVSDIIASKSTSSP